MKEEDFLSLTARTALNFILAGIIIIFMNILENIEQRNKLRFVTFIIPEFARSFKMGKPEAYQYLKKYGGLDFIFEHWWALHTDNPFWSVRDIYHVCLQNGGLR